MRYVILILIALSMLFLGCSTEVDPLACDNKCKGEGFKSGECYELGVIQFPCEEAYNLTTVTDYDALCEPIEKTRGLPHGQKLDGVANKCCCS